MEVLKILVPTVNPTQSKIKPNEAYPDLFKSRSFSRIPIGIDMQMMLLVPHARNIYQGSTKRKKLNEYLVDLTGVPSSMLPLILVASMSLVCLESAEMPWYSYRSDENFNPSSS